MKQRWFNGWIFLRYQVGEISTASLRPTEYDDLTLERNRVANAERIIALSDHAYRALYDGLDRRESVMDLIGQVSKDLSQLEQLDPSLRQNLESVDALMHQVDELARALRSYRDDIEYSPDRLHELEERLDLINRLKRKYGSTIVEILAFGEKASQELEELYHREERLEELKAREMDLRRQVGSLAGQLSEARQHAARGLADAIQEEVAGLAFGYAQVLVDIRQSDSEDGVPVGDRGRGPVRNTFFRWGVNQAPLVQRDRYRLRGILDLAQPGRTATAPGQDRLGGRSFEADARHKNHPVYGRPDPNTRVRRGRCWYRWSNRECLG